MVYHGNIMEYSGLNMFKLFIPSTIVVYHGNIMGIELSRFIT